VDAASTTDDSLSWTDLIACAAQVRARARPHAAARC